MSSNAKQTIVILNGTLIDGSGNAPTQNEAVVIKGNRIRSTGPLPGDVKLQDRNDVNVIEAWLAATVPERRRTGVSGPDPGLDLVPR